MMTDNRDGVVDAVSRMENDILFLRGHVELLAMIAHDDALEEAVQRAFHALASDMRTRTESLNDRFHEAFHAACSARSGEVAE